MPNAPTKHTKRQDYALIKERIESLNRDSEKFLTIDTEKSLSLATDALNLSLAIQEAQAEARSRLNIGYACFRLCKYSEALAHVQQAQQIWSQIGDLEAEREAMHCLGNIYTMTSNYTLAKQYYNQAISLAKKVQDNCAEARALTNLGSLAEKEGNYIDALYLIEEAETQTEMKLRLLDIKEQIAVGAFDAIEKRLLAMERNLNPEKTWEVFEREFLKAHPEFLTYLSRRFPTLSPTELKICAMLKLGHSTKEIARLLFISTNTVLEHRSNIRRKLNLSEKENLTAFMTRL